MERKEATELAHRLIGNIENVLLGKPEVVRKVVASLLAEGHVLLEDVPGVGKTVLAKSLARSISGHFRRIQFTADLLPSDITGLNIYRQQTGDFLFQHGPIFTHVLLADEINRATPRTQSSLLEAMEEGQVTVEGAEYQLQSPFFVIATQNPIELEGTYPLPFSQMDRFMVRLGIGYLDATQERRMLEAQRSASPLDSLQPVLDARQLVELQGLTHQTAAAQEVLDYIVNIVRATRHAESLEYGSSPRGSLDLLHFGQAIALLEGRDYVLPDDVKQAAPHVLSHRVIQKRATRYASVSTTALIEEIVSSIRVPV